MTLIGPKFDHQFHFLFPLSRKNLKGLTHRPSEAKFLFDLGKQILGQQHGATGSYSVPGDLG